MKIIALQSENVKRLRAVQIRPSGAIVKVCGNNGAGKSSVLDSIAYALGGAKLCPPVPVRRGAVDATVTVDLGDLVVERRWPADGGPSVLLVKSSEGARYPSPQKVLDKLIGELSFDPLAFLREKPADQAAILGKAIGLDFREHDRMRAELFEERTVVNRDVAILRGAVARMPEVEDAPDELVSLDDLLAEQDEANSALRAVDDARRSADEARKKREGAELEVARTKKIIEELEAQLKKARDGLVAWTAAVERYRRGESELRDAAGRVAVPDVESIRTRIREVESTNAKVRAKKAREVERAKLEAKEKESAALTDRIARLDAEKAGAIADADFPVPELAFSVAGVTLKGLPFEQASQAEQLRVSLAVGLALNPKLRVVLIRDGSLLDETSLRLVGEMAEAADAQVWIEVVGKGDGTGVVIEDGAVESAPSVPLRLVESEGQT